MEKIWIVTPKLGNAKQRFQYEKLEQFRLVNNVASYHKFDCFSKLLSVALLCLDPI